jgi:hypothetical protein
MKLIKINTDHYIIVDDSEIRKGDYWCNIHLNSYYIDTKAPEASGRFAMNSNAIFINPKKITHSTQPLEEGTTIHNIEHKRWVYIKYIDLLEVKELIGEVDVKNKAELYVWGGVYLTEQEKQQTEIAYITGYNQALEDNKERKYTEEDVNKIRQILVEGAVTNMSCSSAVIELDKYIQSLQPKTEWEVEFIDGKLKLM